MAPQPISQVLKGKQIPFFLDPMSIDKRAHLAIMIVKIIGFWAEVESHLAELLADLLSGEPTAVTAMYQALAGSNAQFDVLRAAAKSRLEDVEFNVFLAVMALARRCAKRRNPLAHGISGVIDEITDGIVILDPKASVMFMAVIKELGQGGAITSEVKANGGQDALNKIYDSMMVYTQKDLQDLLDDMLKVRNFSVMFGNVLRTDATNERGLRAARCRLLCSEPDIQEELDRQSRRPRN